MAKVTALKSSASPPELPGLPPAQERFPAWLWPFVRAYERHRGVPQIRLIHRSIKAVQQILQPQENFFDVFAVWLYFLRDLDIPANRPCPTVHNFAANYRLYWEQAWQPTGLSSDLGSITSPDRRRYVIRWILRQSDGGPPWDIQDLMRAFKDG